MNELEMQKLIVDAVNEEQGFGLKISHRFLVGVPDLIIKPTDRRYGAGLIEAKQREEMKDPNRAFNLEVTPPQKNYLRAAARSGMAAGVASFTKSGNVRTLRLCIYDLRDMESNGYVGYGRDHQPIGDPATRNRDIRYIVNEFFKYDMEQRYAGR